MVAFVHTIKKSLFVMLLIALFIVFSIFCGIVFLVLLNWLMHTEFYINMVGSVEFWLWTLGVPFLLVFFHFLCKAIT